MQRKQKNDTGFNILACDPSMRGWGYAVLCGKRIKTTGIIKTVPKHKKTQIRKGDDDIRRITEINDILIPVIKKYNIKYIVSELPHGSQSASAASMLGMAKGIMHTLAKSFDIGIDWYSEGDCKKQLLGKLSATKMETMEAIDLIYDVPTTKGKKYDADGNIIALWSGVGYIDEAVADALSVHNVAWEQSSIHLF